MKIAVVGGGISGLGSAWLLSEKHEVHLYEADSRLGGHAHTVDVSEGSTKIPVDTGFLVYNELTYPNLIGFFDTLGVETIGSDMSLSIMAKKDHLEWAGNNLNSIFGQRKNLLNPGFYYMLYEIIRFGREAESNLAEARRHALTLGELLEKRRYSKRFLNHYLLPIGAAIWSTPEAEMLSFPAETFIVFFINHKLLQVNDRPQWRSVKNGSRQYVEKAAKRISQIHLDSPVSSVDRKEGKVVVTSRGKSEVFDAVVLATHPPITTKILENITAAESKILGVISYESNRTILHSDPEFMPKTKSCWSSWNVLGTGSGGFAKKVSLTYFINTLQSLPTKINYFVTLNPHAEIQKPLQEFSYGHPKFDQTAIRAQRDLDLIQGSGGVYYAGAWTRYGFHEDGILSAVKVSELLGVKAPWNKTTENLS